MDTNGMHRHLHILEKLPFGSLISGLCVRLYDLLDLAASQAACTDLDCSRRTVDESLHGNEIGLECALLGHADMLTDTTLLLSLSLARNDASGDSSLAADFTSSCHVIIHLILLSEREASFSECQSQLRDYT